MNRFALSITLTFAICIADLMAQPAEAVISRDIVEIDEQVKTEKQILAERRKVFYGRLIKSEQIRNQHIKDFSDSYHRIAAALDNEDAKDAKVKTDCGILCRMSAILK